ncbi:Transcription factor HEX [Handroanthus impetiginosus]|uniref:Transcription factor HEX n=1 Tax=Handroanthus impetiginosus TaxID=429701 RepID=A0A2G9HIP9_9LAMI|nr:Transcription factor HEX [Handroanthus impetiginosus]
MSEVHSEDDKGFPEKNKKRTVKTRAQVQALEKFYNERKYPTESMKIQLAESIGLTEKQVSGWFCHRRLKDKRLMNGENNIVGRQDWSSGVIQDHGSGHKQDSCGSSKQGDDKNLDREVESGRLPLQECSAAELTYERGVHYCGNHTRMDDASSGSSSSLRNMSNHNHKGEPIDVATSRYLIPKYPMDLKPRSGPSGYLKVKGRVENAAITAVKRQLGKDYREDGPPLGVEFDPLPPGAFEYSMQDSVDETCYNREAFLSVPPDISKFHQHPKFSKGPEYYSGTCHNSNIIRTSFKATQGSDIPDNYINERFRQSASLSNTGAYYSRRNSFVELPDVPGRDISDDYGMRYRQPFCGKLRGETESSFHNYNDVHRKSSKGETIENRPSNLNLKIFKCHNLFDNTQPRRIAKDGRSYAERRMINENQAPKRMRDEFHQQPHLKRASMLENQPGTYRVMRHEAQMPSSYSEDEGSAETSTSVE